MPWKLSQSLLLNWKPWKKFFAGNFLSSALALGLLCSAKAHAEAVLIHPPDGRIPIIAYDLATGQVLLTDGRSRQQAVNLRLEPHLNNFKMSVVHETSNQNPQLILKFEDSIGEKIVIINFKDGQVLGPLLIPPNLGKPLKFGFEIARGVGLVLFENSLMPLSLAGHSKIDLDRIIDQAMGRMGVEDVGPENFDNLLKEIRLLLDSEINSTTLVDKFSDSRKTATKKSKNEKVLLGVEFVAVESLLQNLNSSDLRQASGSAEALVSYPYAQVRDALIAKVSQIFSDHSLKTPNTHIAMKALQSLKSMVSSSDSEKILNLRRVIEANHDNPIFGKIMNHVFSSLEDLERAVESNKNAIPTYVGKQAPTPVGSQAQSSRTNPPQGAGLQTVAEMINEKVPDPMTKQLLMWLVGNAESNLYDNAIKKLSSGRPLQEFFGRSDELQKLSEALRRDKKAHALLTGKAGVGKTTLLEMLVAEWMLGRMPFPGKEIPIVLELSIADVTNQTDPNLIKQKIAAAQTLSQILDRHVVLFIDEAHVASEMAKNSIKGFLAKSVKNANQVHMVWATTTGESRRFLADSAFARRWVEIDVPEFSGPASIELVRQTKLKFWQSEYRKDQISFGDISAEAYDYALKYSGFEQPHAGNPTGIIELFEGAIIFKLDRLVQKKKAGQVIENRDRNFVITPSDIRDYLKFHKGFKLIPGDKDFDQTFEKMWSDFEIDYSGSDSLKQAEKKRLKSHFSKLQPQQMYARGLFGPSGSGKGFLPEMIAKHFFNSRPLVLNGADSAYANGGYGLNKLVGSSTGLIGSNEELSVLTKFIKDHPNGGVIEVENADLLHQDIIEFFAAMVTNKEMEDGLGKTFNTSKYLLFLSSSVGQELTIADEGNGNKMTWQDLAKRRAAITERIQIDGNVFEDVQERVVAKVFKQFVDKVFRRSNPNDDRAEVSQIAEKLRRIFDVSYVLPPTQEELVLAAKNKTKEFIKSSQSEYGVHFKIPESVILEILDLKNYRFVEGYAYVQKQLDRRLFDYMTSYLSEKGSNFELSLEKESVQIAQREVSGLRLVVSKDGKPLSKHSLGVLVPQAQNPWFNDPDMLARIRSFPEEISKHIKGQEKQIIETTAMLKQKALNWSSRLVLTQVGTSGNGKTEYFFAMAEVLFGRRDAAFKISGLQRMGDLNNFFRSDVGYLGSNDETEFEAWFKSRLSTGGGIILFDELLSFTGLDKHQVAERINVMNKLYDLLAEGTLQIGSKKYDARGFVIGITGNVLQELFSNIDDSPNAERLVQKILNQTSSSDVVRHLISIGIDPAKIARLGKIFLNGPLTQEQSKQVGRKEIDRKVREIIAETSQLYDAQVQISDSIVDLIVSRVSTVKLGMRHVEDAIKTLVTGPVTGILFDLVGTSKIIANLDKDKNIVWTADGKEVVKYAKVVSNGSEINGVWEFKNTKKRERVSTPQISDVTEQPKIVLSPLAVHITAVHEVYGHWMVGYLLNGKNNSEMISLIPDATSLGRVSHKSDLTSFEGETWLTWLKRIVELEAGHRAVFLEGIYSSGGGSFESRKSDLDTHDDLGRIELILNAVLSNQIFDHYREFGSDGDNQFFKDRIREIAKAMADHLIIHGKSLQLFQPLFEKVKKDRFVMGGDIEAFLNFPPDKKAEIAKLGAGDSNLLWSLSVAILKVNEALLNKKMKAKNFQKWQHLSAEILQKISTEIQTRLQFQNQPGLIPWAKQITDKTLSSIQKGPVFQCKSLFELN